MRILLVEDDDFMREISQVKLGLDLGADTVVCASGNEAMELIKKDNNFDLIVSDFRMPDGCGMTLLEFLEKQQLSIPFFFYTSEVDPEVRTTYSAYKGIIHKFEYAKLIERAMSLKV